MSELKISAINNGVVIDHIKNDITQKLFSHLDIVDKTEMVSVAFNLKSSKMGYKGIIKIENKTLTENEINKISIMSPGCTINYVKNGKIEKKIICEIPKKVNNILQCKTSKCISNNEKNIYSIFTIEQKKATCMFCERTFDLIELEIKDEK